jgi:hypothetical protein
MQQCTKHLWKNSGTKCHFASQESYDVASRMSNARRVRNCAVVSLVVSSHLDILAHQKGTEHLADGQNLGEKMICADGATKHAFLYFVHTYRGKVHTSGITT